MTWTKDLSVHTSSSLRFTEKPAKNCIYCRGFSCAIFCSFITLILTGEKKENKCAGFMGGKTQEKNVWKCIAELNIKVKSSNLKQLSGFKMQVLSHQYNTVFSSIALKGCHFPHYCPNQADTISPRTKGKTVESNLCPGKQLYQWIINKTTPSLSYFQHRTQQAMVPIPADRQQTQQSTSTPPLKELRLPRLGGDSWTQLA